MEFVSFELAKKLKEKGFSCKYPLAMYNESGWFCPLYTSADRNPNIKSVFGNREYYDYDDFDEYDFVAPTIEQVMEWLRSKNIYIEVVVDDESDEPLTYNVHVGNETVYHHHGEYFPLKDWNQCQLAGIEYTLDHLL